MAQAAFDTLSIARELEREYGFQAKQAEGAAVMLHRHIVGHIATKEDLRQTEQTLRKDIEHLDEKLTEKITAETSKLGKELFKQLWLMGAGIVGLTVTLVKLLP